MRDEAPALHAENKSRRSFGVPTLITRRQLERVERAVDFNRIEFAAGELQLEPVREFFRIKHTAPTGVGPPGYSDVQVLAGPFLRPPRQMISRESCHKIPCFSQSFRKADNPSFSWAPY